jgi:drug/metabolite transporter (DMT)-like permease
VLQAAALDHGSLIVVQSLTAMSLVLALPLGVRLTNQRISGRVWLGALAMVAGIIAFLSVGAPSSGTATPSAAEWVAAGACSSVIVAILVLLGRSRAGAPRALLLGSAAGVCYAMQASVTKVFVTLVGSGIATYLTSWTIYVLIASALVGFALQQSALKTGVLAPAMGSSNAVTLFMSVVWASPSSTRTCTAAVVAASLRSSASRSRCSAWACSRVRSHRRPPATVRARPARGHCDATTPPTARSPSRR